MYTALFGTGYNLIYLRQCVDYFIQSTALLAL